MIFLVEVDKPEGATMTQLKGYIKDSVASSKGLLHPEDPLFELNENSVKVKSVGVNKEGLCQLPTTKAVGLHLALVGLTLKA